MKIKKNKNKATEKNPGVKLIKKKKSKKPGGKCVNILIHSLREV